MGNSQPNHTPTPMKSKRFAERKVCLQPKPRAGLSNLWLKPRKDQRAEPSSLEISNQTKGVSGTLTASLAVTSTTSRDGALCRICGWPLSKGVVPEAHTGDLQGFRELYTSRNRQLGAREESTKGCRTPKFRRIKPLSRKEVPSVARQQSDSGQGSWGTAPSKPTEFSHFAFSRLNRRLSAGTRCASPHHCTLRADNLFPSSQAHGWEGHVSPAWMVPGLLPVADLDEE